MIINISLAGGGLVPWPRSCLSPPVRSPSCGPALTHAEPCLPFPAPSSEFRVQGRRLTWHAAQTLTPARSGGGTLLLLEGPEKCSITLRVYGGIEKLPQPHTCGLKCWVPNQWTDWIVGVSCVSLPLSSSCSEPPTLRHPPLVLSILLILRVPKGCYRSLGGSPAFPTPSLTPIGGPPN